MSECGLGVIGKLKYSHPLSIPRDKFGADLLISSEHRFILLLQSTTVLLAEGKQRSSTANDRERRLI